MILAFDTSSAACTVALFDGDGACVARRDELIGRGHSERLVPMIAELLDGRTADRILVGVGPGSFTGIRVAIAAAHGLAIGWDAAAERELGKIPFFVRGKARRNTEAYAAERGTTTVTVDTLYEAKAHYGR